MFWPKNYTVDQTRAETPAEVQHKSSANTVFLFFFFLMQIREYEEYLNRRHAVCNGKEEDLDVLQNVNELSVWCSCFYHCVLLYLWCVLHREGDQVVVSKSEMNLLKLHSIVLVGGAKRSNQTLRDKIHEGDRRFCCWFRPLVDLIPPFSKC